MHGCVGDLALFMLLLLFFVYRSRAWISRREISVLSVLLKESLMGCVGSEIKLVLEWVEIWVIQIRLRICHNCLNTNRRVHTTRLSWRSL